MRVTAEPPAPQQAEAVHSISLIVQRLVSLHGQRKWNAHEWVEAIQQLCDEGKLHG